MAKQWIGTGSSVDDAVQKGLQELKLTREQINVTVLEERSSGLLSMMGFKRVRIRLTEKVAGQPNQGGGPRGRDENYGRGEGRDRERQGFRREGREHGRRDERNDRGDRNDRNGGRRGGQGGGNLRRHEEGGRDSRDFRDRDSREGREPRDNREGRDNRDFRDKDSRDNRGDRDNRDNRDNRGDRRENDRRGGRFQGRDRDRNRNRNRDGGRDRDQNRDQRFNQGGQRNVPAPQQNQPAEPPPPTPIARMEATASLSEDERALVEEFSRETQAPAPEARPIIDDEPDDAEETPLEEAEQEHDDLEADAEMAPDEEGEFERSPAPAPASRQTQAPRGPAAAPPRAQETSKNAPVPPAEILAQFKSLMGWDDLQWAEEDARGHRQKIALKTARGEQLMARGGEALEAFEYLFNLIFSRRWEDAPYVTFVVEGFSDPKEQKIIQIAQRAAAEARRSGRPYRLDPMESAERRLVHQALANESDVETFSEGEGPFRKVVVRPKKR